MCAHCSIILNFCTCSAPDPLLTIVILAADHEPQSCDLEITHSLRYQSMNNVLFFASPTVNDTGEMLCSSNSTTHDRASSIFIAVGKICTMSYNNMFTLVFYYTKLSIHKAATQNC